MENPLRSEMDKLWEELGKVRDALAEVKTAMAVGDTNRQHLRDEVKAASDKISAMNGKIDALVTTIATARGSVTAGTWLVRTLGGGALALAGWAAAHIATIKQGSTGPWAP